MVGRSAYILNGAQGESKTRTFEVYGYPFLARKKI